MVSFPQWEAGSQSWPWLRAPHSETLTNSHWGCDIQLTDGGWTLREVTWLSPPTEEPGGSGEGGWTHL